MCHAKWASGGIGRRTTLKMWREIVRVRVSLRPCLKALYDISLSRFLATYESYALLKTYSKANLAESKKREKRVHTYPNYLSA
jgi:hypothetical protein